MAESGNVIWTGHPLLDVGVATLCAMVRKRDPAELTLDDLDAAADEIQAAFSLKWLNSYLSCLYPNGAFTNPTMGEDKRRAEITRALRCHRLRTTGRREIRCAFTGLHAVDILDRRHVPLYSGEGVISFAPFAFGGLPVAGWVSLALHAFAFGARRALGRALAVHADDRELIRLFAAKNLEENRRAVQLAQVASEGKYPDVKAPLTLVMSVLVHAFRARRDAEHAQSFASLTVYHLTNSGQGPDIDVHELDSSVVRFISRAQGAKYRQAFDALVHSMWHRDVVAEGRGKKRTREFVIPKDPNPEYNRNYLLDDLWRLPDGSPRFIRTYFLGRKIRRPGNVTTEDPRTESRVRLQVGQVPWELITLFLMEVLAMDRKRIEAIRAIGDRIAKRIAGQNDRRLLNSLLQADRYGQLRTRLVKTTAEEVRAGRELLVGMDEFLLVFEDGGELARVDWSLARDLLCLRVIEQLQQQKYFAAHPDALDELSENESGVPGETTKREEYIS